MTLDPVTEFLKRQHHSAILDNLDELPDESDVDYPDDEDEEEADW